MNVLNKFQYHICDVEFQKKYILLVCTQGSQKEKKWKSHNYAKIP